MRMTNTMHFKTIPSFSQYEISQTGIVRAIVSGAIMKQETSKHAPASVRLLRDDLENVRSVAALLLETFEGQRRYPYTTPIFNDGDMTNCTLSNLSWGTREDFEVLSALFAQENGPVLKNDFKTISSFPSYEVDSQGNVRKRGGDRFLKTMQHSDSSLRRVTLYVDGKLHQVAVAGLVLDAFQGNKPEGLHTPYHKDGDHSNFAISNLGWKHRKAPDRPDSARILDATAIKEIKKSSEDNAALCARYKTSNTVIQAIRGSRSSADTLGVQKDGFVEIPNCAGRYEISRNGMIRWKKSKKVLKAFSSSSQTVPRVNLETIDGKFIRTIASVVLNTFVGPAPKDRTCAIFLDNDVNNARVENLKWGTHSESLIQAAARKRASKAYSEAAQTKEEPPQVEDVCASEFAEAIECEPERAVVLRPGTWRPAYELPVHLKVNFKQYRRRVLAA